ncbi:MAG: serine hydrolase domain-containing protein [Burkholderiales bacterium]
MACLAAQAAGPQDVPFPPDKKAALDAALDRSFAASKAPGVIAGVWVAGEGAYIATRGFANPATREPMRVADHMRIGSNTKTFTVTALLVLVKEEKLVLDDPVSKYVGFVPNGKAITLRMLADMTSGLFNYTEDDAWVKKILTDPKRTWTPRELVDVGLAHPPYFEPGKGWHYSNTNTVLLGMIIEKVTGKPIAKVFQEKLYKPLGLTQTSWPTGSALPSPFAHGFTQQTLDGKEADATFRNPSWAFTAGALVSSLKDLRTWVESYTTGSLITPELQKERTTWVTLPPNTPQRAYGLGIGFDRGWLGHTGELPGYNTGAYYFPEKKATVVVMVNSDVPTAGNLGPATPIMRELIKVITPQNVPE